MLRLVHSSLGPVRPRPKPRLCAESEIERKLRAIRRGRPRLAAVIDALVDDFYLRFGTEGDGSAS